jgi:hypothetical protein
MKKILLFFILLFYSCSNKEVNPIIIYKPIINKSYNNYRINFYYKNVSNKKIKAIEIKFIGENIFKEKITINNDTARLYSKSGIGISGEILNPNEIAAGTFDIKKTNAIKIISAKPTKVAFTDGTIWNPNK